VLKQEHTSMNGHNKWLAQQYSLKNLKSTFPLLTSFLPSRVYMHREVRFNRAI
jgi:hypothetical protein